jgi:RNA polymerase sigma-70 factor (ECF subfamily)
MFFAIPDSASPEGDGPSFSDLVLLARTGDEKAFESLYMRYYGQLSHYLINLVGDDSVGNELTQETFFKAWRALPGLRDASTFVGWLYRIATNLARDNQRRMRYIHWEPYTEDSERIAGESPVASVEQFEAEEDLKAALARIPTEYRACLILYHLQGVSLERIATYLGIKESSVRSYISLGLKKLRKQLVDEDNRPERAERGR